jgi:molybdenum cofactor cytidylyltransferase
MAATTNLRTAGIVLAAGASRRMGTNKLLLVYEGELLVRRACRRALEAGLDPVIVVLGHEADQVRAALDGLNCVFAVSLDVGGPMSGSLHAGFANLPSGTGAAVVILADMPHVTSDMLRALMQAAEETKVPLIVSDYEGIHAPPILFGRPLFPELQASEGEGVGRSVIQRHLGECKVMQWVPDALTDIDTPEQLTRASEASRQ